MTSDDDDDAELKMKIKQLGSNFACHLNMNLPVSKGWTTPFWLQRLLPQLWLIAPNFWWLLPFLFLPVVLAHPTSPVVSHSIADISNPQFIFFSCKCPALSLSLGDDRLEVLTWPLNLTTNVYSGNDDHRHCSRHWLDTIWALCNCFGSRLAKE